MMCSQMRHFCEFQALYISSFRTTSQGFLIRTILLVHIISEVYGCSFFSQWLVFGPLVVILIGIWGTCSRCFRWFLWDCFLSMGHIIFSLCLIIWMGEKKQLLFIDLSPFDTLADLTLFICHGATAQAQWPQLRSFQRQVWFNSTFDNIGKSPKLY